ncbi:MAG: AraC family transcriptional regulator [Desulfobacter sp.]
MNSPIHVRTDYTEPSGGASDILGRFTYDVRGNDNTRELVRLFRVKDGLALSVSDSGYARLSEVEYETINTPVNFSFVLSGQAFQQVRGLPCGKTLEFSLDAGKSVITSMPHTSGRFTIPPQKALTVVELKMDRTLLHTYLGDRINKIPKEILDLMDHGKHVCVQRAMSPQMIDLLVQIVRPPAYRPGILPLFYESRALDLLAMQLESFYLSEKAEPKFSLNATDTERIHAARQILLSTFRDPPTISTLAKDCGINEFKLKKGFKQTFHTTIFGFIKQQKMETAWQLIEDGQLSVTQAASEVGYTNISHFINAFRQHFSINPGQLKKARNLERLRLKPL